MLWRNMIHRFSELRTYWEDCMGGLTPLKARRRIVQIEPYRRQVLQRRFKRRLQERAARNG